MNVPSIRPVNPWPAYLYLAKIRLVSGFAYSFEVVVRLFTNFVFLVMTVFVWKAAYAGKSSMQGVTADQMVTYSIISILLGAVFTNRVHMTVNMKVREGTIGTDLLRPIDPVLSWFFDDIGWAADAFLFQMVPLLACSVLLFQVPLPASLSAFGLFLVSSCLSYVILWSISAATAMTAFWTLDIGNLNFVRMQIVRILSGSFVPLWFFPRWFQDVSNYLPFVYTFQAPLGIYIGVTHGAEAFRIIGLQAVWAAGLVLFLRAVWSAARRRVIVQGG